MEAISGGQQPYEFVKPALGRSTAPSEFRLDPLGGEVAVLVKGRKVTLMGEAYDRLRARSPGAWTNQSKGKKHHGSSR